MPTSSRVEAAKAYLGTGWVLHPRYDPLAHPAHRTQAPYVLPQFFQQRKPS